MKYTALFALFTLIPVALAGTRVTGRNPVEISPAEFGLLEKKDCVPTDCSCEAVPNGLFCGDGLFNCIPGNVYQCGGDGTLSCDFGVRDSCVQCGQLQC